MTGMPCPAKNLEPCKQSLVNDHRTCLTQTMSDAFFRVQFTSHFSLSWVTAR